VRTAARLALTRPLVSTRCRIRPGLGDLGAAELRRLGNSHKRLARVDASSQLPKVEAVEHRRERPEPHRAHLLVEGVVGGVSSHVADHRPSTVVRGPVGAVVGGATGTLVTAPSSIILASRLGLLRSMRAAAES
jgi:hypothetical protein